MKFKYVFIPADVSDQIEEMEMEQTEGKEVECLLDSLKEHFRRRHGGKSAVQLEAQKQELLKKLPEGTKLQDTMLDVATSLGLVENIALLNNAKNLGFVGVNMYVDDEGAIKDAPFNPRASDIATCCGKPLQVRGDAFIGRIFDNEDEFRRMDFSISEVSSSADWVKEAKRRNDEANASRPSASATPWAGLQKKAAENRAAVRELSPAEAAREDGNKAFKKGDFQKAVEMYSKALTHEPEMLPALNNRAMAHIKLGSFQPALEDCEAVLAREPENVKALLRRATCRTKLGSSGAAREDLVRVMELEPSNRQAQADLEALRSQ